MTVAPLWKIDPANASGPGPADTVLPLPKMFKAKLAPGRLGAAAVTSLSSPRMLTAALKKPFDETWEMPSALAPPSRLRARLAKPPALVEVCPAFPLPTPTAMLRVPRVAAEPGPSCQALLTKPEAAADFPVPSPRPTAILPMPRVAAEPGPSCQAIPPRPEAAADCPVPSPRPTAILPKPSVIAVPGPICVATPKSVVKPCAMASLPIAVAKLKALKLNGDIEAWALSPIAREPPKRPVALATAPSPIAIAYVDKLLVHPLPFPSPKIEKHDAWAGAAPPIAPVASAPETRAPSSTPLLARILFMDIPFRWCGDLAPSGSKAPAPRIEGCTTFAGGPDSATV